MKFPHPDYLLEQLTSAQLSEWEAMDRLDPIGEWTGNFRLAYLCSLLTNLTISTHGKKGSKFTTPVDFMIDWDLEKLNEPKQQSVEDMKQILLGIADAQNKSVQKKEGLKDFDKRPPKRFRQQNKYTSGL